MKHLVLKKILFYCTGALLLLCGHWVEYPTRAMDQQTSFDAQLGMVGRSEFYGQLLSQHTRFPLEKATTLMTATLSPSVVTQTLTYTTYCPMTVVETSFPMEELRGLWVTRFDWTSSIYTSSPSDIQTIVANAAYAGFNTILFQIRGAGDSFYTPGLEPWSARLSTGPVSETLGVNPGWDPLAVMLQTAHDNDIEVHAYLNVYPAWLSPPNNTQGDLWPPPTTPPQMFDLFTYGPDHSVHPGLYAMGWDWRQHQYPDTPMLLQWNSYLWATPGVDEVHDHIVAVATDILTRYAVDGIHLDLVRYAGSSYSYDPMSNALAGEQRTPQRDAWQRERISSLVNRISVASQTYRPAAVVSAAVWPVYIDLWGWGASEGYNDYFQDSKGWLQTGAVDAIMPMLYGSLADDMVKWQMLMADFLATPGDGVIYPGIGTYDGDNFEPILERITSARNAGASGHVIFSYSGLAQYNFWDDLRNGPYKRPAVVPSH